MLETLKEAIMSITKAMMLRDIQEYLVIVGPGEFHFCEPMDMEFKRLIGQENLRRDLLPERYLVEEWRITYVKNMDEVLDLYKEVVLDNEEVDH